MLGMGVCTAKATFSQETAFVLSNTPHSFPSIVIITSWENIYTNQLKKAI